MKYFEFSENNSGGSWWLTTTNYRSLLQTGAWGLELATLEKVDGRDFEIKIRQSLVGCFDNINAARQSFESITGQDLDAKGCECCGPPFYLGEIKLKSDFVNNVKMGLTLIKTLPA